LDDVTWYWKSALQATLPMAAWTMNVGAVDNSSKQANCFHHFIPHAAATDQGFNPHVGATSQGMHLS
jgi:hypothetical protein